jgi:hypothetical protein
VFAEPAAQDIKIEWLKSFARYKLILNMFLRKEDLYKVIIKNGSKGVDFKNYLTV